MGLCKKKWCAFFSFFTNITRDQCIGNLHTLIDRIEIYAYVGIYSSIDVQTKMITTNIELPLDDKKLNELGKILRDLSECDIYKLQAQYVMVCTNHRFVWCKKINLWRVWTAHYIYNERHLYWYKCSKW